MTVVYADVLLFLNWVIDYLLLCGCARVLPLPFSRVRILLGAAVGALSSLLILLEPMNTALSLVCKFGVALLTVPIAFPLCSFKQFGKAVITLFVLSALFAGLCSLLYTLAAPSAMLVQNGYVYVSLPPLTLLALTVASYGILCVYDRFTRKRMLRNAAFELDIGYREEHVTLRAFFDSGHKLRDSFSGAPVVVVRREALGALRALAEPSTAHTHACSMRYIPFSSIGGSGVLPSFRPTAACLRSGHKTIRLDGIRVAISDHLGDDEYDALIGADIAMSGDCL